MPGLAGIWAIVALASPVAAPRVEGTRVYIAAGDRPETLARYFRRGGAPLARAAIRDEPGRPVPAREAVYGSGRDDGLEIYRGKWTMRPDGATVTYRLVDYAVPFPGVERALGEDLSTAAAVAGSRLRMAIVSSGRQALAGGSLAFARANTASCTAGGSIQRMSGEATCGRTRG